jgi:hypothetical protein
MGGEEGMEVSKEASLKSEWNSPPHQKCGLSNAAFSLQQRLCYQD